MAFFQETSGLFASALDLCAVLKKVENWALDQCISQSPKLNLTLFRESRPEERLSKLTGRGDPVGASWAK
jgi:hypothetical protein